MDAAPPGAEQGGVRSGCARRGAGARAGRPLPGVKEEAPARAGRGHRLLPGEVFFTRLFRPPPLQPHSSPARGEGLLFTADTDRPGPRKLGRSPLPNPEVPKKDEIA